MTELILVKTEDSEFRKIMTGYTPAEGVVQVITDNPYTSIIVEYNKKGTVINLEIQADPKVKKI